MHNEAVGRFVADRQGRFVAAIVATHDVSELTRDAERARRLAYFDPLTELPNRRLLVDRLAQAIAVARRDGRRIGASAC